MVPGSEQTGAQARASPEHLPELDPRVDRLEEDQVGHLGHVDAGVEHVDRDRDVRRLVPPREVVEQALRIRGVVIDDAGEVPRVPRVVVVEPLLDERRVLVVAREDDRLGQAVPTVDLVAVLHQMPQHLVDGVAVEEPVVDGGRVDPVRQPAAVLVVAPVEALPLRLLFLAERVVVDAVAREPEIHLLHPRRHEKAVGHRGRELVRVGGHARFQLEELVGVPVDLVARRRGQAHQQRVEVPEDGPVLLIHRAVRLVDDHEIEVPDPEAGLAARRLVDEPHHRRIGADVDPARLVLLGHQVHRARLGQVGLERRHRLVHQRQPVGEKQRALHPARPLQQVDQRDGHAGLAAAGRHHQQRLAPRLAELLADAADGPLLVVPLDDDVPHPRHVQRLTVGPPVQQRRQLVLLVEAGDGPRRVGLVVPQVGLVPVRVVDDGTLAVHRLQAIGVELGLLSALLRIDGGLLRLHHSQRLPVVAPEDVIGVADPRRVRHARDRVLTVVLLVERPASPLQGEVDDQPAGRALVPVMGLGDRLVLGLDGRELLTQRPRVAFVPLASVLGRFLAPLAGVQCLDAGRSRARRSLGDEGLVEGLALQALRPLPQIGAARPVEDLRQLPHHVQRLLGRGRPVAVHRDVARLPDVLRLPPHHLGHQRTERGIAEVCVEVRDLRRAQGPLDPVDPLDQTLQRMSGMEAGGPRVAVDVMLRIARALRRVRELLLQEREVGGNLHGGSELSPECAGLQGGEESDELGQVGALARPLALDGFGDGCELVLEIEGWELNPGGAHLRDGNGVQP